MMRTRRAKENAVAGAASIPYELASGVINRNRNGELERGKKGEVEVIDCYGVAKWVSKKGKSERGGGGEVEVVDLSSTVSRVVCRTGLLSGNGRGPGVIDLSSSEAEEPEEIVTGFGAVANGTHDKEEEDGTRVGGEDVGIRVGGEENGVFVKEETATLVRRRVNGKSALKENGTTVITKEKETHRVNGKFAKKDKVTIPITEENRTHVKEVVTRICVKEEENGTIVKEEENGIVMKEVANEAHVTAVYISEKMAEEERLLAEEREKEERAKASEETVLPQSLVLEETMFSKLDNLLNKSQMYSQFLLEKMEKLDNAPFITEQQQPKKGRGNGRGIKRKAAAVISRSATKAAAPESCPVLPDGVEDGAVKIDNGDDFLSEQERVAKEQKEIIPLLTGGTLKSFQLKGIKWMISLWQNGLNGILADQMGLGKTIQTIGLLAHHKGRGMNGPFLVIAPLSTLSNWFSEMKRWVPSMPVILYHGSKDERTEMRRQMPATGSPKFPVVVTSYEIAIFDRPHLARRTWQYIIVDEGHRLKNFDCKLLRELRRVPVVNKLLLTGTPLQNNLSELWSLLNFILPDIFTSLEQFESWFELAGKQSGNGVNKEEIHEERRLEVVTKLHGILRPFLLRRLKQDVQKNIPPKKEILFYAPLSETQKKFQDLLLNRTLNEHFEANKQPGAVYKNRLNNVVMQLRKNANHPDLLVSHFDDSIDYPPVKELLAQCGKLKMLDRLLKILRARGHKVLIFSQMVMMLDVLEYYLQENGMNPCRIDGKVKLIDRQEQIRQFNSDSHSRYVFLLSTRAGGLGINLTAADTVIIYDSDWNPQMDLQAMDRCHRIGQDKPVHVYRLLTAQTVECRMIKVASRKMQLERVVIEKGHFRQEQHVPKSKLDESDLMFLLRQDRDEEEEYVQSREISNTDLLIALDRTDLMANMKGHAPPPNPGPVLPIRGPGWEVVIKPDSENNILSSIEGYRKFPVDVEKVEDVEAVEDVVKVEVKTENMGSFVKMEVEVKTEYMESFVKME